MRCPGWFAPALSVVAFAVCATRLPAAAADCPATFILESTNGHDYVVVFDAKTPTHASFYVEAYAKSATYAFTLSDVPIDNMTAMQERPYHSPPTLFSNPGPEPLLAARVRATLAGGVPCSERRVQIPSAASLKAMDRSVKPNFAATQAEVARDVAALRTVVIPDKISSEPFPCDKPFTQAAAPKIVSPSYPAIARETGATGSVRIRISLAATGALTGASIYHSSNNPALDEAALNAARRSTYTPEIFACRPVSGEYLFISDFGRG